jgi:DNA-binding PadR family transcriptional regulator
MTRPSLTLATGIVLQCIDAGYRYGFDIMDASGLPDGTVYPALRRLEAAGFLTAEWEDEAETEGRSRPARRYYALTPAGRRRLAEARARFPVMSTLNPAPRNA